MRLTCLKCGHQMEVATGMGGMRLSCVCGQDYSSPDVLNTGTRPDEAAAERSRSKAFRAAGLVKNWGGFGLGISLLGILFFPVALLGAGIGIYTLTMLRGPLGRYSGRRSAMLAVAIGSMVFLVEGAVAANWIKARRLERIVSVQSSVSEDLRALLRAQRLFRATNDTYGTFAEFRFRPPSGKYTVYLGSDDLVAAERDGEKIIDELPLEYYPAVSESTFTAFAVANIDDDAFSDIWRLDDQGTITHIADDATNRLHEEVAADAAADAAGDTAADGEQPTGETPSEVPEQPAAPPTPTPAIAPQPAPVVPQPAAPTPAPEPEAAPGPEAKPVDAVPDEGGDEDAEAGSKGGDEPADEEKPAAAVEPAAEAAEPSIDALLDSAPD